MTAPDPLLTPEEVARRLTKSIRQLDTWRYLNQGPPYVKVGRSVRYYESDLNAWLAANRVETDGGD